MVLSTFKLFQFKWQKNDELCFYRTVYRIAGNIKFGIMVMAFGNLNEQRHRHPSVEFKLKFGDSPIHQKLYLTKYSRHILLQY